MELLKSFFFCVNAVFFWKVIHCCINCNDIEDFLFDVIKRDETIILDNFLLSYVCLWNRLEWILKVFMLQLCFTRRYCCSVVHVCLYLSVCFGNLDWKMAEFNVTIYFNASIYRRDFVTEYLLLWDAKNLFSRLRLGTNLEVKKGIATYLELAYTQTVGFEWVSIKRINEMRQFEISD